MQRIRSMRLRFGGAVLAVACVSLGFVAAAADAPVWTRQIGTKGDEAALGVATDGKGNVYLAGTTDGSLCGDNHGKADAWVAKYDADGNRQWLRQPGTAEDDSAAGVAADGAGNVYVVGHTYGVFGGGQNAAGNVWMAKYDAKGARLWVRQFGTTAGDDAATGVATDHAGNVYVTGYTYGPLGGLFRGGETDGWVAKYDANGNRLWARQIGTREGDGAYGVTTDAVGNVYLTGSTSGSLGGANQGRADAWVAKYDAYGNRRWIRQLTDSELSAGFNDVGNSVATDRLQNVYVAGSSAACCGPAQFLSSYGWVAKYDAQGHWQWTHTLDFGGGWASATSVATNADGDIYLAGYTRPGSPHPFNITDAWVAKYNAAGTQAWAWRVGLSNRDDAAGGVATDNSGNFYLAGATAGAFAGPYHGGADAFLVKYADR